jgi:hypothetical protein
MDPDSGSQLFHEGEYCWKEGKGTCYKYRPSAWKRQFATNLCHYSKRRTGTPLPSDLRKI